MMNTMKNIGTKTLIYSLACWLLIEWLLPLKTVSDTANVEVFIGFVAVCFLFYLLRIPMWISAFVKIRAASSHQRRTSAATESNLYSQGYYLCLKI